MCSDKLDNDGDKLADCRDLDCEAATCQAKTTVDLTVERDTGVTSGRDGIYEADLQEKLPLSASSGGATWAMFYFESFPAGAGLTVHSAKLSVYSETGGQTLIAYDSSDATIDMPTPNPNAGIQTFDVTSLVKRWAKDSKAKRVIKISGSGTVLRALEYGSNAAMLKVQYESTCNVGACQTL